ncbi:MAG: hypothetical protein HY911_01605 [Desulfobacterales bacterium]|nr:hypothetical protein [Desulfobacterales bacterium]
MKLKRYQPERTDLLINTEWGISADRMSRETAGKSGLKLFHGRWVTQAEKKRLRDEYSTYHALLIVGYLLMLLTLPIVINIAEIAQGGLLTTSLALIYALAMYAAGLGLIRFKKFGRNIALFVFLSFLFLPFTPLLRDEKSAPLLIMAGIGGLYYLLRKTARKIFAPPSIERDAATPHKRLGLRMLIYLMPTILAVFTLYTLYDLRQAKNMAAAVCTQAIEGMPLEDFLSTVSTENFKIFEGTDVTMIVPRRGMGRNQCMVYHDGFRITDAKTAFND